MVAALMLGVLLVPAAHASAACPSGGAAPNGGYKNTVKLRSAVLCLVNAQRTQRGLPPRRVSPRLRNAANRHSRDMVAQRFFDHRSPAGHDVIDRARDAGYVKPRRTWSVAENLAWGTGTFATPRSVVRQWMESPGHRANILNGSLRDAGVGIAASTPEGGLGGTYTLVLGRR